MNRLFCAALFGLFAASGCEEVPPPIDFSKPVAGLLDSTSVLASAPAAQHKIILLEDVTGVRCNNCPQAAVKAKDILNAKTEDSVIVMALYPSPPFLDNFTTPFPGVPKMATDIAREIVEGVAVNNSMPFGYVDRSLFSGSSSKVLDYNLWASKVNERLAMKTPVNIELSKSFDGASKELIVTVKLTYTSDVASGNHKLSVYLTESNIVSTQRNIFTGTDDPAYVHNHALRHAFTPSLGSALNAPLVKGRLFIKQYKYVLPDNFDPDECHIIAVVAATADESVMNVRTIPVK